MLGFPKRLKWCAPLTGCTAVRRFAIVFKQPFIPLGLPVFQGSIQLLAEGDLIELILKGALEPRANAMGWR
jgi:hypothetical protein